jgi:predicted O-methyltransferase YrrM
VRDPQEFYELYGWFDNFFGNAQAQRYYTFKAAIGLFLQRCYARGGGNIVETGTLRYANDWVGGGCSTLAFAETLEAFDAGHLWTVDISEQSLAVARQETAKVAQRISYVQQDSLEFLANFDRPIDLLYLDSWDWFPNEPQLTQCQEHQLKELQAAYPKLEPSSVILLDDNQLPGGGKTRLTKVFLREQGWHCVLDYQQSLWVAGTVWF